MTAADTSGTATDGPTLTPSFADLLPPWVERQRWYAGKGRRPQLHRVGGVRLVDPSGEVGIETHLVADRSGAEPTVYQVPLTYRTAPLAGADHVLVGVAEHSSLGTRYIYDGCHDPVFAQALLDLVVDEQTVGSGPDSVGDATGHRQAGPLADAASTARVAEASALKGEQSNTSVIIKLLPSEDGSQPKPLIAKIFRVLHDGLNPDVVVQSALAEAGSDLVPQPVGSVSGSWPDPDAYDEDAPGAPLKGHLAFVQEFLPGVEDAWRVALRALGDGIDFSARARALGVATARVHVVLADVLPTTEPTAEHVAAAIASLEHRLAAAVAEVPSLAEHEPAVIALYEAARQTPWPRLQRIHGDYHLGQVLDVPGRGWVLLDFEGEPLRPLSERSLPDLALRDVAGMLRSFDYAGGSYAQAHPGRSAASWVAAASQAFLAGYAEESGRDPRADGVLLSALEVDKALYEVVYEARNRPTWLTIPTTAITRLLSARRSDPS